GDQSVPTAISANGKALWETEVALLSGSDSSIANGVYYAKRIHLFMTRAQANAYHYWWLVSSGNEGLIATGAFPTKRLFTFGQYSRFVRPNSYRIDATSSQASAWISAYKDSNSMAFAIVMINTNAASVVTFVGRGNTQPTIGFVPNNQTVNPGATLLITNTASDSDLPPQALTFSA